MQAKWIRAGGLAVPLLAVAAVAGFGGALEGYSQARHPVSLLGAAGVPHAAAFNLLGFGLVGLLAAALAAFGLKTPRSGAWARRIGARLLLVSALALCAMGVWPLDPGNLDGPASQRHASAWLAWALAFVAGTALIGLSCWGRPRVTACAWLCGGAALLVGAAALLPGLLPPAWAQRLAFLVWILWWPLALRCWPPRAAA